MILQLISDLAGYCPYGRNCMLDNCGGNAYAQGRRMAGQTL
jgi:hypothetical protein